MMVWAIGSKPPPPIPCSPRAKTSSQIVGASAQAIEPSTNMPMASSSTARRP